MRSETSACAVDEEQLFNRRAIAHSPVDDVGNIADAGCDDRLDGCAVQAILKVVFLEHEGRGTHDAAKLRKRRGDEPELVVPTHDDHDEIATANAVRSKHVRSLVGPFLHVGKGEDVFFALGVAPNHGTAFGIVYANVVNNVVSKVEVIGVMD